MSPATVPWIDEVRTAWDFSSMKLIIADQKNRISLPDIQPGDAFHIEADGTDLYKLRRIGGAPVRHDTPAAVKKAMRASPLRSQISSAVLHRLTREYMATDNDIALDR